MIIELTPIEVKELKLCIICREKELEKALAMFENVSVADQIMNKLSRLDDIREKIKELE